MSHDPHHIIEVLPVHLRLALPEETQGGGTRSNWANQRLLRTCLMALRSLTIDMTSFLQGIAPRATNQLLQSRSQHHPGGGSDPPKDMQHHPGGGRGVGSDAPPPWERRAPPPDQGG